MTSAYILRSKNRPGYEAYEPESISAWSEQPDLSIAPEEAWEAVGDLGVALSEAPAFQTLAPEAQPEAQPEQEEIAE